MRRTAWSARHHGYSQRTIVPVKKRFTNLVDAVVADELKIGLLWAIHVVTAVQANVQDVYSGL